LEWRCVPLVPVRLPLPDQQPNITSLFEDSEGQTWVGTKNSGAYVIRSGEPDVQPVPELLSPSAADGIQSIVEGRAGEIWIGTYSRGILIVDGATLAIRRIRHDPFVPGSLDDDLIWALHRDEAGAIWVGTSRGLSRHDPDQNTVFTVFGGAGRGVRRVYPIRMSAPFCP
jgi:ligand-binding sensor domain-containing protein